MRIGLWTPVGEAIAGDRAQELDANRPPRDAARGDASEAGAPMAIRGRSVNAETTPAYTSLLGKHVTFVGSD